MLLRMHDRVRGRYLMSPVSMPDAAQKPFNVLLDTKQRQLLERERERRGLRSWGEVVRAMIDALERK